MSVNRLTQVFEHCKNEGRAALVGYLTAGDPNLKTSRELLLTLQNKATFLKSACLFPIRWLMAL